MRLLAILLFLALSPAHKAGAQSFDFWGDISIGANGLEDYNAIGRIDATISLSFAQIEDRPLSVELGTFAYFIRHDRPHETYVSLVFDDRWRLGAVRPAYDLVLPSVFAFTAPAVANVRAEYVRAHATTEAMRLNSVPWGVSYTGQTGETEWAVSAHDAQDGDFASVSGGLRWTGSPVKFAIATELVWDPRGSFQGVNAKAGGRWSPEPWEIGLTYLHPDANRRPDALALDVTYQVAPRVSLLAFGEITDNGHDEAYGLGARYAATSVSEIVFSGTTGQTGDILHLTYSRRH